MKKMLILGALSMLMGPAANATLFNYAVYETGSVSTTSYGPGTTVGTGTAQLDDSTGILTISMATQLQIPAAAVITNVTTTTAIAGTLSGPALTPTMSPVSGFPASSVTYTSCVDLGLPVPCTYIALNVAGPMASITDPILFDNNPGGSTSIVTGEVLAGGLAFGINSFTLTTVPEPGTLLLIGSGVIGLGAFGRKRAA